MIYDTFEELARYKGIHPNLDEALNFMEEVNLPDLPLGKTEINGDKVFINIMEADLKPVNEGRYEFHKKYLDIQFNLVGEEVLSIGFLADKDSGDYDPTIDFGTIHCQKEIFLPLGPERFIICMLGEPHKPGIQGSLGSKVKKGVIKILIEE